MTDILLLPGEIIIEGQSVLDSLSVNHKPFNDISNTVYVITESSDNAL